MLLGWPSIERAPRVPRTWQARTLDGCFSGAVVVLNVDHQKLRHTLPPGLVTDATLHGATHPLILMVGIQNRVHPVAFGYRWQFPAMNRYHEACLVVPDLKHEPKVATSSERVLYFARLYLDRLAPTLYGRWPYGWNKCLAKFTGSPHRLRIERRRKGILLDMTVRAGSATNGDDQHRRAIRNWLSQPAIIGIKRVGWPSRLQFDWSTAAESPADVSLKLGPRLLIGVDPQTRNSRDESPETCLGMHLTAAWSLLTGRPESCAPRSDRPHTDSILQPAKTSA